MTAPTPAKVEAALGVLAGLRDEMKGLPHSLGYEYTHMAKVDQALATITDALAERERDAVNWRRRSTRYPYTHAYDLLRSRRPLSGDNSRGDMSQHVTTLCEVAGADKAKVCEALADAYIAYEQTIDEAYAAREAAIDAAMPPPTKDTP